MDGETVRLVGWLVKRPWRYPDGSICQTYLLIAGVALLVTFCDAVLDKNIVRPIVLFFLPGLLIAWLFKGMLWQTEQTNLACGALRDIAVNECRCVSSSEGYRSGCHVCRARDVLKEHFPDKVPLYSK